MNEWTDERAALEHKHKYHLYEIKKTTNRIFLLIAYNFIVKFDKNIKQSATEYY